MSADNCHPRPFHETILIDINTTACVLCGAEWTDETESPHVEE